MPGQPPVSLQPGDGIPLGISDGARYDTHVQPFGAGSTVVVYSDGAVEQPNPEGEQFGVEAVLRSIGAASRETITEALVADVRAHAQGDLADDLTVAAITRSG